MSNINISIFDISSFDIVLHILYLCITVVEFYLLVTCYRVLEMDSYFSNAGPSYDLVVHLQRK